MGMDGSGKSSISSFITEELIKEGYNVSFHWWLEAEQSVLRKFLKLLFHNASGNSKKLGTNILERKRNKKKLFNYFYPRIVLIDYLIFGIFHVTIPYKLGGKKIIIFDRYYSDTIWSLKNEFNLHIENMIIIKIFRFLIPEPDLLFFIDVSPEIALERKKSELLNITNSKKIWHQHNEMFKFFVNSKGSKSSIIHIDNSLEFSAVKMNIWNVLQEKNRLNK